MAQDNLSLEGRLMAQEVLIRALFAYRGPLERDAIRTQIGAEMTAVEATAIRASDEAALLRAAEVRAALERMTE